MDSNNRRYLIAVIIAAVITLLVDFLLNIAASFVAPQLEDYTIWVYLLLGLTFLLSLLLTVYLLRPSSPPTHTTRVSQSASGGGEITNSPINASGAADIQQEASNRGQIRDSGIKVE